MPGFGTYNDPLFDDVLALQDVAVEGEWSCSPNPARGQTSLLPPSTLSVADRAALSWSLRDSQGHVLREGQGTGVKLDGLASGHHVIQVRHGKRNVHVRVLVVGPE